MKIIESIVKFFKFQPLPEKLKPEDFYYEPIAKLSNGICYSSIGITEPVISFLETFIKTPKRFKLERVGNLLKNSTIHYSFTDKETKESWIIKRCIKYPSNYSEFPYFLNCSEQDLIVEVITYYFSRRRLAINEHKAKRLEVKQNIERERLKKVYC